MHPFGIYFLYQNTWVSGRINLVLSLVKWLRKNSLLWKKETLAQVTATGLEPRTAYFVNEHSTIWPNWPNDWAVFWVLICTVHLSVQSECSFECSFVDSLWNAYVTWQEQAVWCRCFPVNFAKFLRTVSFTKRFWWLLLLFVIEAVLISKQITGCSFGALLETNDKSSLKLNVFSCMIFQCWFNILKSFIAILHW